jgi:hypothetical protein
MLNRIDAFCAGNKVGSAATACGEARLHGS